jgi:hypothetical protein
MKRLRKGTKVKVWGSGGCHPGANGSDLYLYRIVLGYLPNESEEEK